MTHNNEILVYNISEKSEAGVLCVHAARPVFCLKPMQTQPKYSPLKSRDPALQKIRHLWSNNLYEEHKLAAEKSIWTGVDKTASQK